MSSSQFFTIVGSSPSFRAEELMRTQALSACCETSYARSWGLVDCRLWPTRCAKDDHVQTLMAKALTDLITCEMQAFS